jgi:6-phosphogluconolactonase (cycloisomerase 2 family)
VADGGAIDAYSISGASLIVVPGSPFCLPAPNACGGTTRSVTVDTTGRFVYAGDDLDNIYIFTINPNTGALAPIAGSPVIQSAVGGKSVTSIAFETTGRFAYAVNNAGSVSAFSINAANGALTPIASSPFPAGTSPFVMAVDPAGPFAYVANAGDNTVSAYTIDGTTGALTPVAGSPFATGTSATNGVSPRSVTVDPTGQFVYTANQGGDVSAYSINGATGALSAVPGSPFAAGSQPVSVAVDTRGQFAYVANASSNNVSAYAINRTTGALAPAPGSPFASGPFPASVAVAAPAVFFDGTFNNSGWQVTNFTNSTGTTSGAQALSGGNPGAYRQTTNNVGPAPSANCLGNVVGFHAKTGAVYNPAQQGSITSIDYAEDAILISGGGDGQGAGPALIQGGQVYLGPEHVTPSFSWTHFTNPGLLAGDFSAVDTTAFCSSFVNSSKHPDFSASGSPIQFGFWRANSTGTGATSGYTTVGGVDNWTVLVH